MAKDDAYARGLTSVKQPMLSRRSFLRGLSAAVPLVGLPYSGPYSGHAQAARPGLHALVVGINTYTGRDARGPIRSLRGCLNDADDIEAQVRRLGAASFRRLGWDAAGKTERPVARADVFAAWRDMLAAARAGDTLLFTYSGHGSQVPVLAGNPSREADGMDETLVLTGYSVADGRNGELIIDDELDELFRAAHAKGLIVVFASDSCHSGTVYRTVELRDVSYRTLRPDPAARGGPAAAPMTAPGPAAPPEAPPNLLFLAGSQENELVPEITVGGRYRGALSVAVARALEGRAATDGVITAYGLARFVLAHVRDLSDAGQHPNVTWPSPTAAPTGGASKATPTTVLGVSRSTPLIVLGQAPGPTAPPAPAAPAAGHVLLRILGLPPAEQERIVRSLANAALAGEGQAASLVWDAGRSLILNDQGHRIAEDVDARQLQHAVDRRRALDRLIAMSAEAGLEVRILLAGVETPASDATHKPGTRFNISLDGVADGAHFVVLNLTGNGKVQMLKPTPYLRMEDYPSRPSFDGPDFKTGVRVRGAGARILLTGGFVTDDGPFGAEHVVAVAGALPLSRLMPVLAKAHNRLAVPDVMAGLASEAEVQPLQVGFRGIYTARA
jgi:hypothetical protein